MAVFFSCKNGKQPEVLLFNGTGVSNNDVAAIEAVLESSHIGYATINSKELNSIDIARLMQYKLLIMPGGNFIDMGNSFDTGSATKVRVAVNQGLHYLGICAGGFLAGSSAYYNGFNLTSGATFSFYAAEKQHISKAMLTITSAGAVPPLDQYWEDGPELSGWGDVVAKYPDNTPAVTEGNCGKGFVMLAGIHAEAPVEWRRGLAPGSPVSACNAYAATLVQAALYGRPLPHY